MLTELLLIVGAIVAIVFIALLITHAQENAKIAQAWKALQTESSSERFSQETIADQPEPVQRYFLHAIAPRTPIASSVDITMQGTIRLAPNQDWMPF